MKKLALLLTVALAFTGLVGVSGSANASPYPGTVKTKVHKVKVKHNVSRHKHAHVKGVVGAKSGNARAVGTVIIRLVRHGQKHQYRKAIVVRVVQLKDGRFNVKLPKLKHGVWHVTIKYLAKNGTVFKDTKIHAHTITSK